MSLIDKVIYDINLITIKKNRSDMTKNMTFSCYLYKNEKKSLGSIFFSSNLGVKIFVNESKMVCNMIPHKNDFLNPKIIVD